MSTYPPVTPRTRLESPGREREHRPDDPLRPISGKDYGYLIPAGLY
jgi:hypothetical protein